MNTKIINVYTMDVSVANDAYNISKNKLPPNITVAAGSWWLSSDDRISSWTSVLRFIFSQIVARIPTLNFWYFVGDACWQDDNRIIRYKKPWKRFNSSVDHISSSFEELINKENKLKYFCAKKLSEQSTESVAKTIAKEPCSYLVALHENADVMAAVRVGWEHHNDFDMRLLQYVLENHGLLFRYFGAFDDPETGFVGLGAPELIKKLI